MDRQRTIGSKVTISGIGLQTGKRVNLRMKPAPADRGVVFIRTDIPGSPEIEAKPLNLKAPDKFLRKRSTVINTTIKKKRAEVCTVEHLLAALSGLSIDNIIIEMDNVEVPGLDGSARGFVSVLRGAGFQELDAPRRFITIERPIICANGDASIQVLPDEQFRVEYFLDYDHPMLREQWADVTLDKSEGSIGFFESQIAPSRTFHVDTLAEPFILRSVAGLGRGADFKSTLVIRKDGPVQNTFRFENEPARHKLLDFLGDLYILGRHIKGRVIAKKSGHKLNSAFVRKLVEELKEN